MTILKFTFKNHHHSEETKQKIGLANKGRKHTPEECKKISVSRMGKIPWNKGKKYSAELRKKISDINKEKMKLVPYEKLAYHKGKHQTPESNIKRSNSLRGKSKPPRTELARIHHRNARLSRVLPVKDTRIEIAIQNELLKRCIKFSKHNNILKKYQVDILVEPNIIIECDGDYWHNLPNIIEKDKRKNKDLIDNGYKVYHFWEHNINKNPSNCIDKIFSMGDYYNDI